MAKLSKDWILSIFKAAQAQYIEQGFLQGIQKGVEQGIRQCIEQGYRSSVNERIVQDIQERTKWDIAEKLVQLDIDTTDILEATDISMTDMAMIRERLGIEEEKVDKKKK